MSIKFAKDFVRDKELLKMFLKSCEIFIERNGRYQHIECFYCPGNGKYNNGIHCDKNNFCSGGSPFLKDEKVVKNAKAFIKEYGNEDNIKNN